MSFVHGVSHLLSTVLMLPNREPDDRRSSEEIIKAFEAAMDSYDHTAEPPDQASNGQAESDAEAPNGRAEPSDEASNGQAGSNAEPSTGGSVGDADDDNETSTTGTTGVP